MPSSRLVTTDHWPAAELHAAVLAGDLVAVGACWASIAEPQDAALRAASFAWSVEDARVVAGGLSAAWIWGACSRPPVPHDGCVPADERFRRKGAWTAVREIALEADDVTTCADVRVLTPAATALDLLRLRRPFSTRDAEALRGLVLAAGVDPAALARGLAENERAPMGRQAQRRFRDAAVWPDHSGRPDRSGTA